MTSEKQGRLHKKRVGGRDFSKGHQRYDFDVIPMEGFKRRSLGGCIFAILELTKGTNSDSLTISGSGGQEHIMQQYKEWEYFSFGVELWANFPIDACKIKNFICHMLKGLCI